MVIATLSQDDIAVVKSTVLCAPMSAADLQFVLAGSKVCEFWRNQYLFEEGEPATNLHVVLEGWIKLSREERDGTTTMIAAFSKGDSLAEAASFIREPYPATAQAMSKVRTLAIEGTRVLDNMVANRDVLGAGLAAIYRQLHFLIDEVDALKSLTIRERVVKFLLKSVHAATGPAMVCLPYDKSLVAAKIGTSPEHLSRTFADLRDIGVTINGREAHIAEVEDLKNYLQR